MREEDVDPRRSEAVASACRDYASIFRQQSDGASHGRRSDWPVMHDRPVIDDG
jgi:hypothetical protein